MQLWLSDSGVTVVTGGTNTLDVSLLSLPPIKEEPQEKTRNQKWNNSLRFNRVWLPKSPRNNDKDVDE